MTSGANATSSAAYLRVFPASPALQRYSNSTLTPAVQPNCFRVSASAATRAWPSGSPAGVTMSTPIRRIRSGCCARAAIGHTAAPPSSVMKSRRLTSDIAAFSPTSCEHRTPDGHGAVWLVCHPLSVSRRGRQVLGHAARARNGCLDPIVHGCRKRSHLRSAGGCCRDIRYVQHLPSVSRSGRLVTERRDDLHGSLHQHRIVGGKDAALQVKVVF